jgi:hypothetical protein
VSGTKRLRAAGGAAVSPARARRAARGAAGWGLGARRGCGGAVGARRCGGGDEGDRACVHFLCTVIVVTIFWSWRKNAGTRLHEEEIRGAVQCWCMIA